MNPSSIQRGNTVSKQKSVESVISGFSSTILQSYFGKGPQSVHVHVTDSFVCIQIKGFLAPMEQILIGQKEHNKVLETRNLLMLEVNEEFKRVFWKETGLDVIELYADWNLNNKSGMILGVLNGETTGKTEGPKEVNEEKVYDEIIRVSIIGQMKPQATELFWLSDRTLVVKRSGIVTLLEAELIKNGFIENLKMVKRPLECRLFEHSKLACILKRPILEIFVDWNFKEDKGYVIIALDKREQVMN